MRLAVLLAASLACVGIGFAKSAALSAHVKDLETLQKIIQYLRGEIVTAASPLPDAFWETGRRMRDRTGIFTGYFRGYAPPGRKDTAGDSGREYGSPPGGHTPYKRRKRRAAGGRMQPWHWGPRHAEGESGPV